TPCAAAVRWRSRRAADLVETIRAWGGPVDGPWGWLQREPRRMEDTRLGESLWVRVLDAPAALSARTYAPPGRVVFEVVDEFRPDGRAAGRVALDGGPDGAEARPTSDEPDLVVEVAELGGLLLRGGS